jgi:hypothetical protein
MNFVIKEFQWKGNHNIIYTESRLRKMNLSNGRCHLCKESNIQEDLQHLFFKCIISNRFISNITILISALNVGTVGTVNLTQIWLSIQQKTIFREWKKWNSVSWSICITSCDRLKISQKSFKVALLSELSMSKFRSPNNNICS